MELPDKIKKIENKVVRNELKEALELLQSFTEETKIEPIRKEVLNQLSNLKKIQQLDRSNQIEKDKYLIQLSKISGAILTLKDQYSYFIENPDKIPEVEPPVISQENKATANSPVQILQVPDQPFDLFKKVLILLVVLFGLATLYFIFHGLLFQTVSTGSMLLATWGAKIHDDNSKFRMQKLLLEQNLTGQK